MNSQTTVRNMKLCSREEKTKEQHPLSAGVEELPGRENGWNICFLQADRLVRNLAVVGVLLLTVIAVRNTSSPQAQSVFSALQESAGMEWDESVGKLSFVNGLLPETLQEVWKPVTEFTVYTPADGDAMHVWSPSEPYITLESSSGKIRAAADGEVMSVAHGLNEERIIRVRHDDDTEAVYGNLANSYVEIGQRVYAGDVIGTLMEWTPLAFELRVDGRSVNPVGKMIPFEE